MANVSLIYPETLLEVSSQKLIDVMNVAYNKMEKPTAKILAVSWKVGDKVRDGGFERPFNTHEVLISQEQIESIITQTGAWIDQAVLEKGPPEDPDVINQELYYLRQYLEGGAEAANHLSISPDIRILYITAPPHFDALTHQTVFLHETYHALQKDIAIESYVTLSESNPDSNWQWISEGAAEYFAQKTYQELNESYSGSNRFIADASFSYTRDNSTALINGEAIASRGAAALSLMVQKGFLEESIILDGSLFHNSTTETDYLDTNPHILDVKKNWSKIIVENGNYGFSTEALEGGILNTGDDTLNGGASNDTLNGGAGNDTIFADGGSDTIRGGAGLDTIKYALAQSNYTLAVGESISTVKEISTGANDSLSTVERVVFSDKAVALDIGSGEVGGSCYRIYKAAFNRTPDEGGLGYWIGQMDLGKTLVEVSAGFIDSDEFRASYGTNPSNGEFLTKVYNNVLGRDPDSGGYDWWVDQLANNPEKSWSKVMADFSEGTENQANVLELIGNGVQYDLWVA